VQPSINRALHAAGHCIIKKWECGDQNTQDVLPKQETRAYPHTIFYDFELYRDKTKKTRSKHRSHMIPTQKSRSGSSWKSCRGAGKTFGPWSKQSSCQKIKTNGFRFVDIINYLGQGTSYKMWVKAYGNFVQKSWLPYEWFDTVEKLNYPGLPDYPAWYSRSKGEYVLSLSEFQEYKKIFKEKGMQTFTDWLHYYSDLNVAPGLEALEKMRAFYTDKGIAILKDAISLPGVSLHYLLRGTIERGA